MDERRDHTITFGFVVERLPIPAPLAGGKTRPGLASWAPFSATVDRLLYDTPLLRQRLTWPMQQAYQQIVQGV